MSHIKAPIHLRDILIATVLVSTFALSFWEIRNTFADDDPEQNAHQDTVEVPLDTENQT